MVESLPALAARGIYRWDEWLDGNIWELSPGEDFRATPDTVRSAAYQAAKKQGVKVTVREHEGKLYLQARPPEGVARG
jgi:hypothetical protein